MCRALVPGSRGLRDSGVADRRGVRACLWLWWIGVLVAGPVAVWRLGLIGVSRLTGWSWAVDWTRAVPAGYRHPRFQREWRNW